MAELATDRIMADTFRDVFMNYNKPWLKVQLQELFTPRTLFLNRKAIIEELEWVLGEIKPDIVFSDEEREKKKFDFTSQSEHEEEVEPVVKHRVTKECEKVALHWLKRMRFVRMLRV